MTNSKGKSKKTGGKGGAKAASRKVNAPSPKVAKPRTLHPRVMISGYYGFDNLGDELILKVLTDELKARDVKITVLSQNPEKTRREYGVDAISRTNLIDIIDALTQTNLLISGGGGLFQDATGPMSAIYYGGLIHLAQFFEVPVCFWAQGVGPLKGDLSRKMTISALAKCNDIVVRDEGSATLIEELTGVRPDVSADPVWLLKTPKQTPQSSDAASYRIGVSMRPWGELNEARMQALAGSLVAYAGTLPQPVAFRLLPFQKKEDTHLLETFAALLRKKGAAIVEIAKPDDVIAEVGQCRCLVGMRFHSLILALLQGVPAYGLIYDPKVESLLQMFNLQGCPIQALDQLQPETLRNYFDHYPKINLKPLQQKARRNFDILDRLLAIPDRELVL
jgi:polysaccharide pyruvyl transferase CsaB